MSAVQQAQDKVVAAALSLAASRAYLDTQPPGPYDDAELELKHDMLGEALAEYVQAVQAVTEPVQDRLVVDPDSKE